MAVFQQILELDDDETHEYSRELVIAYFSQARSTFKEMDKALYVSFSFTQRAL